MVKKFKVIAKAGGIEGITVKEVSIIKDRLKTKIVLTRQRAFEK